MKALVQRVKYARVTVGGRETGSVGQGLLILLGVMPEDDEKFADYLADRCAGLRIFEDEQGKMNRSLLDIGGAALVVSQFTLCADVSAGRRPSFSGAAHPAKADALYEYFKQALEKLGVRTASGEFGADMLVELGNDGPVTIMLETTLNFAGKPALKPN